MSQQQYHPTQQQVRPATTTQAEAQDMRSSFESLRQCATSLFHQQTRDLTNIAELTQFKEAMETKEQKLRQRLQELQRIRASQEADVERQTQRNKERLALTQKVEVSLVELTSAHAQLQEAVRVSQLTKAQLDEFTARHTSTDAELMRLLSQAGDLLGSSSAADYKNAAGELRRQSTQMTQLYSEIMRDWKESDTTSSASPTKTLPVLLASSLNTLITQWLNTATSYCQRMSSLRVTALVELPEAYKKLKELTAQFSNNEVSANSDQPLPSNKAFQWPSQEAVALEQSRDVAMQQLHAFIQSITAEHQSVKLLLAEHSDDEEPSCFARSTLPDDWQTNLRAQFEEYARVVQEIRDVNREHEEHLAIQRAVAAQKDAVTEQIELTKQQIDTSKVTLQQVHATTEQTNEALAMIQVKVTEQTQMVQSLQERLTAVESEVQSTKNAAEDFLDQAAVAWTEQYIQPHTELWGSWLRALSQRAALLACRQLQLQAEAQLKAQLAQLDQDDEDVRRVSDCLERLIVSNSETIPHATIRTELRSISTGRLSVESQGANSSTSTTPQRTSQHSFIDNVMKSLDEKQNAQRHKLQRRSLELQNEAAVLAERTEELRSKMDEDIAFINNVRRSA